MNTDISSSTSSFATPTSSPMQGFSSGNNSPFMNAVKYAQQNPNSPFANELKTRIQSGQMNDQMKAAGLDPTKYVAQSSAPTSVSNSHNNNGIVGGAVGEFAANVNKDLTARGQEFASAITNAPNRAQKFGSEDYGLLGKAVGNKNVGNVLATGEGALRVTGAAAGGLIDFASDAVKAIPGVGSWIESIKKNLGDQTKASPVDQKIISVLNDFATKHPEATKDLGSILDIVGAVSGVKGAEEFGVKAPEVIQGAKDAVRGVVDTAKGLITKTPEQTSNALIDTTISDATPSYSKKMVGEPAVRTPDITNADGTITKGTVTPRVQEGGVINGRKITPTILEKDAGTALSKIEGYPTNGTNLEKYQSIQPEIAKQGQALRDSLAKETLVRTHGEMMGIVENAVNKVPESSMVLSKTDPVIENYLRVAKNAVDGTDRTLAGQLEFSNKLDNAYENARGKLAFGSDKISALDEIHTAARNALKQDLINSAENTDVKAALKSQWDLYRASDVLRAKAEAESGTALGRFGQNHPIISKVAKPVGRAVGIGAGVHLIP